MKALPEAARRTNGFKRKAGREFCPECGNSGYVVVSIRKEVRPRIVRDKQGVPSAVVAHPAYEEHAPCPFCEQGLAEEFDEQAPWGEGGFWQGRDLPEIQSLNPTGNPLLSLEENRRRVRELGKRLGAVGKEIDSNEGSRTTNRKEHGAQ